MPVFENASLLTFNTFGIEASARYLASVKNLDETQTILRSPKYAALPLLVLGSGSNVLFTRDFEGLVLVNCMQGREIADFSDEKLLITAAAGEVWDDLVNWCVENGWGGLENLSLIPGKVGASPIQNIGAYGTEVKDVMSHLTALDLQSMEITCFTGNECRFGYRNSIFKNELKGRFLVLSVSFLLNKKPDLNLGYPALRQEVLRYSVTPGIREVAEAVKSIRRRKLPDPAVCGNAGSFFKNPVIRKDLFDSLSGKYPKLVGYQDDDGNYKLSAAWMIEACGLKGMRQGDAGVHNLQPLVIVNHGKARGSEIIELSKIIKDSVYEKFQVMLEEEINII
ncbi:MAG: UDP-N-acetylmuramate dehydrogenase [Bacteroidales bacterium]|nr:UDP-N-acetylmuramate dehydrogenase [Bacteroidales bacterium]MDZ4203365.1 UDP-N-acetylmuramate dehydrogenase [Bacteroidales bacterium]